MVSSALFSLSHLTNSQSYYHSGRGLGFLFIFGMLECWQVTSNEFDLRHSIFSHAWYDILVDYGKFGSAQGELAQLPDLGIKLSFAIQ